MRGKSKSFRDDLSVRSEGGALRRSILFSRTRSVAGSRNDQRDHARGDRSRSPPRDKLSSSQSVSAVRSVRSSVGSRGRGGLLGKLRGRGSRLRRGRGGDPEDVSVSDSLCSGVLRGELAGSFAGGSARGSAGVVGEGGAGSSRRSITSDGTGATDCASSVGGRSAGLSTGGRGRVDAGCAVREVAPVPSGVTGSQQNFERTPSDGHLLTSSGTGPLRREARKGRAKEKLERYRRDQQQLKHSFAALEEQLAQTTEKLKEVDSKAATRIEGLESELRESRHGTDHAEGRSATATGDQGEVVKSLGKKLVRQAHVIKKQKDAVEGYRARIDALQEEMDAQDERDHRRAEEYCELKDDYENMLEQKAQIQAMLQKNIEEMMDLKNETERDAKSTMELKFNLEQKEAALGRVTRELSEKANGVRTLELELEEKEMKLEDMVERLKASEMQVEATKTKFKRVDKEVETLRTRCQALEKANNPGKRVRFQLGVLKDEQGRNNSASSAAAKEGGDEGGTATPTSCTDIAKPILDGNDATAGCSPLLLGWNCAQDSTAMGVETFEAELQAKDSTIQTLDGTVTEHEETIQTLRSDMVKMSSTYKQDSYLKRKEIARLKQANAEYALKLRALEKAFKSISGGNAALSSATMHGPSPSARLPMQNGSLRGRSVHAVGPASTREDKAASLRARLGGLLAPPSHDVSKRESQIVVESNFMDDGSFGGSDRNSGEGEGRKGEFPEEC